MLSAEKSTAELNFKATKIELNPDRVIAASELVIAASVSRPDDIPGRSRIVIGTNYADLSAQFDAQVESLSVKAIASSRALLAGAVDGLRKQISCYVNESLLEKVCVFMRNKMLEFTKGQQENPDMQTVANSKAAFLEVFDRLPRNLKVMAAAHCHFGLAAPAENDLSKLTGVSSSFGQYVSNGIILTVQSPPLGTLTEEVVHAIDDKLNFTVRNKSTEVILKSFLEDIIETGNLGLYSLIRGKNYFAYRSVQKILNGQDLNIHDKNDVAAELLADVVVLERYTAEDLKAARERVERHLKEPQPPVIINTNTELFNRFSVVSDSKQILHQLLPVSFKQLMLDFDKRVADAIS